MQKIGITNISITYHRPRVKGRKIWGWLEPYGTVWRAGANENTIIEISDPVTVEGRTLPKGIYGLHMIPGESEWTVIFSKRANSWGSYSYDPAEYARRVPVNTNEIVRRACAISNSTAACSTFGAPGMMQAPIFSIIVSARRML